MEHVVCIPGLLFQEQDHLPVKGLIDKDRLVIKLAGYKLTTYGVLGIKIGCVEFISEGIFRKCLKMKILVLTFLKKVKF